MFSLLQQLFYLYLLFQNLVSIFLLFPPLVLSCVRNCNLPVSCFFFFHTEKGGNLVSPSETRRHEFEYPDTNHGSPS
jgi:hypothetical protein